MQYFLDPPPKKAQEYERSRYCYMHMCFLYTSSLWTGFLLGQNKWFGALKLQNNPFITNII